MCSSDLQAFLALHGFEVAGTDYEADVDPEVEIALDFNGVA